jgi:hypothetical protein
MAEQWLPKKAHDVVVLLASTTTTAGAVDTAGDAVTLPRAPNAIVFTLDVTAAATDAGDTLDIKVQTKLDGTNWVDVCSFTQVLGNGGVKRHIAKILANTAESMFSNADLAAGSVRHLMGDEYRVAYVQVDGGGQNATLTFSVSACPM